MGWNICSGHAIGSSSVMVLPVGGILTVMGMPPRSRRWSVLAKAGAIALPISGRVVAALSLCIMFRV